MKFQPTTKSGIGFDLYLGGPFSIGLIFFVPREDLSMLIEKEWLAFTFAVGPVVLVQLTLNQERVELALLNCVINLFWKY